MSYHELKQHGSADFPFELYKIDQTHPQYEMVYHWHTEHEIVRVEQGQLRMTLNNREILAKTGDIVYINSETVHGAQPEDCIYTCMVFSPEYLSMPGSDFMDGILGHSILITEFFSHGNPAYDRLRTLVDTVFSAIDMPSAGQRFTVVGGLYALFGWIADTHTYEARLAVPFRSDQDERNVQKLKRVLTYIRTAYDQPITLGDMAAAAEVSPQYFCAFFKTMTSQTPVEYLNNYRIERACRRLLNTDESVTEIAFSCGYNDLSYFIKTFKTVKGKTPRQFRRGN